MKTQYLLFFAFMLFLIFSLDGRAQSASGVLATTNRVCKEKTDSLSKPTIVIDDKDKEVYETIKPSTLISTKEFELLLEEKKKKTQIKDPQ